MNNGIHEQDTQDKRSNGEYIETKPEEDRDDHNLESPLVDKAEDNKMIDQLDQLSQMKDQDIQRSSQKSKRSIQKMKYYNNNDINDVVD